MPSYNHITIMGHLTRDPETRQVNNTSVTKIGIAVNENWKDKNGEKQEKVCFFDVEAWGRTGEVIAQYKKKGDPVLVDGRLDQSTWETDQGEKRSRVFVKARNIVMLPRGGDGQRAAAPQPASSPPPAATAPAQGVNDDDEPPF